MELITTILQYSSSANYIILFIIYLIEGPVANLVSAFLAGSGLLNIWYVFFLAATAELLADIIYFAVGHLAKGTAVSNFLDKVEKRSRVFREIKSFTKESPFFTVLFIKMFGPISIPGLMYIGQEGMPWKTFLKYGVPLCVARNIVISFVGYALITSLESFLSVYSVFKTVIVILSLLLFVLLLFLLSRESLEIFLLRYIKNRRSKS